MKTYNTVAIQTDINGVDSNEELTTLFAKALELCQTAKTSQGIYCSLPASTQYLSPGNGTECITIKAEMDDSEYLESMEAVCTQIKLEITDAREESFRYRSAEVVETDDEIAEDEFNEEEEPTSHLVQHVTTSFAEERVKCCVCDEVYISQEALSQHMTTHEGQAHDKAFKQKYTLVKHLRTHTGEIPHKCDICDKAFSEKKNLVCHLRTHTGERPHKCDICDKAFKQKYHLVGHLRTHTGERQHKCDICDKAFAEKRNLVRHLRTHTGEKPHKCDICDKAFADKSTLASHLRTHTGERPHKCDICDKAFTQKCHLVYHLRTHTGERSHK